MKSLKSKWLLYIASTLLLAKLFFVMVIMATNSFAVAFIFLLLFFFLFFIANNKLPRGIAGEASPPHGRITFLEIFGAVALGLAAWGIIDAFVFEPLATRMGKPPGQQ